MGDMRERRPEIEFCRLQHVLILIFAFYAVAFSSDVLPAGSHTLEYMHTLIFSGTKINVTTVWMLDNTVIGHYNSDTEKMVPRQRFMENNLNVQDWDAFSKNTWRLHERHKDYLRAIMRQTNRTRGVHVYQEIAACKIKADGTTKGYAYYGFDGETFIKYDGESSTWTPSSQMASMTAKQWNTQTERAWTYNVVLGDECIEKLKKYLEYGKESLERKVPPIVKVYGRKGSNHSSVSCMVTGFYPQAIAVSWFVNGMEEVSSQEYTDLVPNEDGTYQMTTSMKIYQADNKYIYHCHVDHSSLDEVWKIPWNGNGPEIADGRVFSRIVILAVAVVLVSGLCGFYFLVFIRRRFQA